MRYLRHVLLAMQNVIEILNGLFWKQCLKDVLVGKLSIDITIASSLICFNEGGCGLLSVYDSIGLQPGVF